MPVDTLMLAPSSIRAEQAVLGSLLLDPTRVLDLDLEPGDFFRADHTRIFRWIQTEVAAGRKADVLTLAAHMRGTDSVEAMGGIAYATGLPEQVPSTENLSQYVDLVRSAAGRRQLMRIGMHVTERARTEHDTEPAELASSLLGEILPLTQSRRSGQGWTSLGDALQEAHNRAQERADRPGTLEGLSTGFPSLDRSLDGLRGGELCVVAARPGVGKTALALNIAVRVAQTGVGVGFLSLEMGRLDLAERVLAAEARVSGRRLRTGELDRRTAWPKLDAAHEAVAPLPVWVEECSGLTLGSLQATARRLKALHPELGLLVVDYLQLMEGPQRYRGGNREQDVAACSRGLKQLAMELQLPVLALAQLNRGVEQRSDKRPLLSDLRESGAIEQDADRVLMLYRDDHYQGAQSRVPGECEVLIRKNRHGATGVVTLTWSPECTRFDDPADVVPW